VNQSMIETFLGGLMLLKAPNYVTSSRLHEQSSARYVRTCTYDLSMETKNMVAG
jgi:hypothetical protein